MKAERLPVPCDGIPRSRLSASPDYQKRRGGLVRDRLAHAAERPESAQSTAAHKEKVGLVPLKSAPLHADSQTMRLLDRTLAACSLGAATARRDGPHGPPRTLLARWTRALAGTAPRVRDLSSALLLHHLQAFHEGRSRPVPSARQALEPLSAPLVHEKDGCEHAGAFTSMEEPLV